MKFNVNDEIRIVDWGYDYNGNKIEPGRPGRIYDTVNGKSCYIVEFYRNHLDTSPEWRQNALVSGGNLRLRENLGVYAKVSRDFIGVDGSIIKAGWIGKIKQYYSKHDGYVVKFISEYTTMSNKRQRHTTEALIGEHYLKGISARTFSTVNETTPLDLLSDIRLDKRLWRC